MWMYKDFKCESCGEVFESFVAHTDNEAKCQCGGTAKKRIAPVRVKGDPLSDPNWEKKRMKQIEYERKKEAQ